VNLFKFFELTEIMRQREDLELRVVPLREINDIPSHAFRLFYSNDKANTYNTVKLAQINTEEFTSMAKDTVNAASIPVRDRLKYMIISWSSRIKNF